MGLDLLDLANGAHAGFATAPEEPDCDTDPDKRRKARRTYYRAVTFDDLRELGMFGLIQSRAARDGVPYLDALKLAAEPQMVSKHIMAADLYRTPFVSTTTEAAVAEQYARSNPADTGQIVTYRTLGYPYAEGLYTDAEWLFFYSIGDLPGDELFISSSVK